MASFDKLRRQLDSMAAGANTSCHEFTRLLKEFGFDVRDGRKGGHKIVTHDSLPLTAEDAANYNCGHNPGTMIKRNYLKIFLRIVDEYEIALRRYLK